MTDKLCKEKGCKRPTRSPSQDMCNTHYQREWAKKKREKDRTAYNEYHRLYKQRKAAEKKALGDYMVEDKEGGR